MTESTHDLISAKAARLRALLEQMPEPSDETNHGSARSEGPDMAKVTPSWSGGWNN